MLRNTKSIGIKMDTPLDVLTSHVCTICFSNETHTLKCADNFCTTRVCEDCFKVYLGHCLSEKSLVKCLNQYCKSYIVSNSFKPYNDYFELYKKVLVTAFMHSQGPEVKDKMITTKMISDLRSERRKFLKQFPKAIELVVNVALSKKLNTIDKQNKLVISSLVTSSNKLCMTSHCNGKLNDKFICMKCSTKFCDKCEKVYKESHKCNEADVESLKFINTIMKCPNCGISIEKSEGCNGMTCASCKTTFDYGTGAASGHGSTNVIVGPQKTRFKFDFKQNYEPNITKKLFIIESKEPKEPSITILNNTIKKLLILQEEGKLEEIDKVGYDIIKSFEKYIKSKLDYITFISVTVDITEQHMADVLTEDYLDEIIAKLG